MQTLLTGDSGFARRNVREYLERKEYVGLISIFKRQSEVVEHDKSRY